MLTQGHKGKTCSLMQFTFQNSLWNQAEAGLIFVWLHPCPELNALNKSPAQQTMSQSLLGRDPTQVSLQTGSHHHTSRQQAPPTWHPHLRSHIRAVQSSPPVYIQRPSSWKPTDAMFLLTPS